MIEKDIAFDAGSEAIHKATEAATANQIARETDTAALLAQVDLHMKYQSEKNKLDMHDSLVKIVSDALGDNPTRYIDTSRIPLICKSIFNIEANLIEMKKNMVNQDQFWPVKTITYAGAGIVLTAVVGALVALVVNK